MNLANALVAKGHTVVLWSAAFNHTTKRHRRRSFSTIAISDRLQINLLPSIGYRRNIGPGRLLDHAELAFRLATLLRSGEFPAPDVAFVGYPPIECAAVMLRWLRRRSIPSVVDVKDLWPSLFLEPLPAAARPLAKLALAPYFWLGRRALRDATGFSTMSEGYLDWMARFAGRELTARDIVVPLTAPEATISEAQLREAGDWWRERGVVLDDRRRVCFFGTFNSVFDFSGVRDAASRMAQEGSECQFVICGSGGHEREIREMMSGLPNVVFPGWVDSPKMAALARASIASLNPYRNIENFILNMPNKVVDALANGLPIVTSLTGVVQRMVEDEAVGFACTMEPGRDWYSAISRLLSDTDLQAAMSVRARALYDRRFAFEKVYGALVSHLESLAHDGP
ncbi:MAG: glycosyltransferase family 4 protein [Rhodocyclales bacterium]|nr:glycosyltransferase family 4 protein [Rhodocyclales bacterium]